MIWSLALWPFLAGLAVWRLGDRSRWLTSVLTALAMVVTLVLALAAGEWTGMATWAPRLTLRAGLVPLSHPVAVMVPAVALAVVVFAAGHEAARGLGRLMGLMLMFTGAMELVVIAGDLVTLLIGGGDGRRVLGTDRPPLARGRRDAGGELRVRDDACGDLGLFVAVFACFAGAGSVDYAAFDRLEGWQLGVAAFGVLIAAGAKAGQVPFCRGCSGRWRAPPRSRLCSILRRWWRRGLIWSPASIPGSPLRRVFRPGHGAAV